MLVSYEEVVECSEEGFRNLNRMCRTVFMRHYSMYEQYYSEMCSNAITSVYEALPKYNPNYSWVNYLYTVIRNSYTKDVNKYKKTFIRENADIRNEVSNIKDNYSINMTYKRISEYIKSFKLNKKHSKYLLELLDYNGIVVSGVTYKKEILNINEYDEDYIGRIVGLILYDYFEEVGGVI